MRILLIEDEAGIAEMIRQGLESSHYEVDVALDGCSGLNLAVTGACGLLVLDIMLPKMDGWSICETLRASERSCVATKSTGPELFGLQIWRSIPVRTRILALLLCLPVANPPYNTGSAGSKARIPVVPQCNPANELPSVYVDRAGRSGP